LILFPANYTSKAVIKVFTKCAFNAENLPTDGVNSVHELQICKQFPPDSILSN